MFFEKSRKNKWVKEIQVFCNLTIETKRNLKLLKPKYLLSLAKIAKKICNRCASDQFVIGQVLEFLIQNPTLIENFVLADDDKFSKDLNSLIVKAKNLKQSIIDGLEIRRDAEAYDIFMEIKSEISNSLPINVNLKEFACISLIRDLLKSGCINLKKEFIEKINEFPLRYIYSLNLKTLPNNYLKSSDSCSTGSDQGMLSGGR